MRSRLAGLRALGRPRALETLFNRLIAAWTHSADTGNPNGSGDAPWPRFTGDGASKYLVQDIPSFSTMPVADFRAAHKCDFFDAQLKY
jgi:para-nitrobenzyl esterase